MPRMVKPGSVLAMKFGRGREAICRVIADVPDCPVTNRMLAKRGPTPVMCVVVTRWEGRAGTATEKAARGKKARLPRAFDRASEEESRWIGCWVSAEAPRAPFRLIGFVPLSSAEKALAAHPDTAHRGGSRRLAGRIVGMDHWDSLVRMTRAQWEWDHNRARIVAARKRGEAREKASAIRAARAREREWRRLAKRGVGALGRRRFFGAWRGDVPARMIAACERAAHAAIVSLASGERSQEEKIRGLAALMRSFNALDGKHGHSFSTIDAETLVETALEIAAALGVSEKQFDRRIDPLRNF